MAIPLEDRDDISPTDPVGGGGGGYDPGNGTPSFNTGTEFLSVTFPKHDATSDLRIEVYAAMSNRDDLQMQVYIILDGIIVQAGRMNQIYDGTESDASDVAYLKAIVSGIAAGTHTCKVAARNLAIRKHPTTVATGANIEIMEITQAAM